MVLTPPHPQVRVKLAEAEGLGALTQGVEGTELAPPAPSSTHTGEERRGIRAGSHFFFVVGKEDVPGATALPGTHMQSSQRRQACEVERLGGGGGQGGRAERERQRARVGRWGLGPEEGRDRAAAAAPGRSKRAGSRLAGGLAEGAGGGRCRQPLEAKTSRLHSRFFFGSQLGTPSTPPHRVSLLRNPGRDAYLPVAFTSRGRLPPGCLK